MNGRPPAGPAPGPWVLGTLALAVGLAAATLLAATPLSPFRDGPPAAVTGGFGEDSCYACHWDSLNDGKGELRIVGLPERFEPGDAYPLQVVLTRPGMEVAGFQLSARFAEDGGQAGDLVPGEGEKGRVSVATQGEVQYIQHLLPGIVLAGPDSASWAMVWKAPTASGPVKFHVAAVAGDDDESQIGDFVYTVEKDSRSREP